MAENTSSKSAVKVFKVIATSANTACPLTERCVKARTVKIQQRRANGGSAAQLAIYVGDSGVLSTGAMGVELAAPVTGQILDEKNFEAGPGQFIDMSTIFIAAVQATDAVTVSYEPF